MSTIQMILSRVEALEKEMTALQRDMNEYKNEQKNTHAIIVEMKLRLDTIYSIGKWAVGISTTLNAGVAIAVIVNFLTHTGK